ncbi:D-alanyl-D-alanine carboxypeptidase family protein [Aureimonas sp. N4]|uniref:D-alanyl-D-alanine carboxypeptidase family protein n=1 Tax=Aureimonas sp. N4 TaxID=1638165 RepID=UPI001FCDB7E1|nr:D-alanyl-D-alanine carboxypeptidase family protein [Aureimonas sp. N4]
MSQLVTFRRRVSALRLSHSCLPTRWMGISLALSLFGAPAQAQTQDAPFFTDTVARGALIMDVETGGILLEKNADEPFAPASLAKLMTADVALSALASGRINLTDAYPVSDHAWRTGGAPSRTATMFAAVRSSVPIDALVKGLVIQSANDAAIILAEGMDGSEAAFAQHMNRRAAELGLSNSYFVNATGLPQEGQKTTARDMALLARNIQISYPEPYKLYAQPEFEWNRILQRNRNPLLRLNMGATGLATGFAEDEGYSIVAATEKDGRKTIVVLSGLESDAARTKEAARLFEWTATNFERRSLFSAGQVLGQAQVFGGATGYVNAVLESGVDLYVPRKRTDLVTARIVYDAPLIAPLAKGTRIGSLKISIQGRQVLERDVFVGDGVAEGAFSARAASAVKELAFGWVRRL